MKNSTYTKIAITIIIVLLIIVVFSIIGNSKNEKKENKTENSISNNLNVTDISNNTKNIESQINGVKKEEINNEETVKFIQEDLEKIQIDGIDSNSIKIIDGKPINSGSNDNEITTEITEVQNEVINH